jgi:4-amino-4-deoxy-L-arabinose transferase-like glycosyltransferase
MDVLNPGASTAPLAAAASSNRKWLVGLLLLALVVRVATLGAYPLMDNTEARYAEIARKIVETGDWVMPQFKYGVPFWSKPPLSMWMTAVSYFAFGISEFSARLASLVACLPVAWMTYRLAAVRDGTDDGLRASVVLVTTPLFFVSAGAVMTDPALVLGTTLSMAGFWFAMTQTGAVACAWGYAFFVGLAIGLLAKGPVGAVLTLAPVGLWTLWKGGIGNVWRRMPWISGLLLTIVLAVPWYVLAERRTPGFIDYFLVGEHWKRYTESGWKGDMFGTAHQQPRGMIWPMALLFTLPWSGLWLIQFRHFRLAAARRESARPDDGWVAYLWLWMMTPIVFFTFAGNILFTYFLPGVPAFALLVARGWSAIAVPSRREALMRYSGLDTPIVVALLVLFVVPRIALMYSHRALVSEYLAQRASDRERLVYLHEAPQSAEFYARGKLTTVEGAHNLDPYLADGTRTFFALTDDQLKDTVVERRDLAPLGRFGRYTLYAEKPGAP